MKINHRIRALTFTLLLLAVVQASAFFDPHIGRWASRDPIAERGGENTYSFVANRPVSRVDRLGLMTLSHLGEGFQFVPGDNKFWLGIYSRFSAADYRALGGNGSGNVQAYVVSRAALTWAKIRRCCDSESFSGSATAFFLDMFPMNAAGGVVGASQRATPVLTDGSIALYFNPLNTTATELLTCSANTLPLTAVTGPSEGTISLDWKANLLANAPGIQEGFWHPGPGGTIQDGPSPFGVEANHKLSFMPTVPGGPDEPTAWTMAPKASVSYSMTFQWSDCGGRKRKFTPSPVLPEGAQRPDREPAAGAEFYRTPQNTGF